MESVRPEKTCKSEWSMMALEMKNSIRTAGVAFISSRIICGVFVYLGHLQRDYLSRVNGGWEGVANWWLNPWTTYDSRAYLDIALQGYQIHTTPFFPLYPLLMRVFGNSEVSMALAGFTISNFCFFFALNVLYLLTTIDYGEPVAKTTVWFLAFFPTTAFFSAVYTESLFLLLLLLCFHSARLQRWKSAGVFGFLAAMTRNPGVLITVALGFEYYRSLQLNWRSFKYADLVGVFLPILGLTLVQGYYWYIFGDPLAGFTSQKLYGREFSWPWSPVWNDLTSTFNPHSFNFITFVSVAFTIIAFLLTIKYFRKIYTSYTVMIFGILLMHLTVARTLSPFTIGSVRYLSTMFPFVQLLGLALTPFETNSRQVAVGLYFYICLIFSYGFGYKGFLG